MAEHDDVTDYDSAEFQHALRNKLGIISGSIDLILATESLSPVVQEDLRRMRRACSDLVYMAERIGERRRPHATPVRNIARVA
ncbi:hypothetical protein ACFSC3_11115 [Sphingomonas floccifaciens]|uniref:Uncharacterized protein n=1 Tax=Sphingomonas floccifaciens TaxID=1844115 RepID=A0ABW4NDP0_9SPHN